MSVDILASTGDSLNVTNVAWRVALEFAHHFGWKPAGTSRPDWLSPAEPWDSTYDPAMGQLISSSDAVSLGEAIQHGLKSPQLSEALSKVAADLDHQAESLGFQDGATTNVSSKTVDMLREVAAIATKSGGFRIT